MMAVINCSKGAAQKSCNVQPQMAPIVAPNGSDGKCEGLVTWHVATPAICTTPSPLQLLYATGLQSNITRQTSQLIFGQSLSQGLHHVR